MGDKWEGLVDLLPSVRADLRRMEALAGPYGSWVREIESVFGTVEVAAAEKENMGENGMEDVPFNVHEDYEVGDVSEVKEDRQNVPAASGVLMRVAAASVRSSPDGSITSVAVQVNLVEGVDVSDPANGTVVKRYAGKPLFADLPFRVDTAIRTSSRYTSKHRPYLVPLKQFWAALGYDLTAPPKIGDNWLMEIIGRELRADIRLRAVRIKNPVTQQYEDVAGEFRNEVRGFKPV